MTNILYGQKHVMPNRELVVGSFTPGIQNVDATYTLAIAAGDNVTLTSDSAGTAGNALDFQATDDGRTVNMETETGDSNFDGIVRFDEDDWSITLVSGAGAGEGLDYYEDTTNKILTIWYEDNVSDMADFETAIGASTHGAVHTGVTDDTVKLKAASGHVVYQAAATAATWVEESGSPSKTHLHFTDAVSTSKDAQDAINGTYDTGSKTMTASGAGAADAMASGDAVAKQDLSGGVDAVAVSNVVGAGFSVSQTGTGEHTVTMDTEYWDMEDCQATLQLNALDDKYCIPKSYTASTKKLVIKTYDKSGGAAADVTAHANNKINFAAIMKKVA